MVSQLLSVLADSTSGFGEQIISALHRLQGGQHLLQTSRTHESHYTEMHPWNLVTFLLLLLLLQIVNHLPVTFLLQIVNHLPAESTS